MFAQLGDIVFENLKSFENFNKTGAAVYAEHAVLEGKPRLQKTGDSLHEVNIPLRLHISFCDPASELKILRRYRDEGAILPLLWGTGELEGNYVITEVSETIEEADPTGDVLAYKVSLILKEFVIINRLQSEQEKNRKAATATGDKKPVAKKKTNLGTCPKIVTDTVTKIDNHAKEINAIVLEKGGVNTAANKNSVLHHLSAIRLLVEDLLKRCDDTNSCATALPDLKYRATQVFNAVNNFNRVVSASNQAQVPSENQILAACARNLKTTARPLIEQTITRK